MFNPNALYYSDGYKPGHKRMLAEGTDFLYGTWIPRSLKHAPKGITKVVSFGHQLTWRWIHDQYTENFFGKSLEEALQFGKDMSEYLGQKYDDTHFVELYTLGYLPLKVKALPEGIETDVNVPHQTFVNTVAGFAWLPLYLETIISSLSWKASTSATIAKLYRRNTEEWVNKTDENSMFLVDYMCHDFSSRGLDPFSMLSSGLGHATSFRGSDSLIVIPGSRYFYKEVGMCINSVNASEHSVSTTKIFTVGEKQMIIDWLKEFPIGILSIVADTFDLWKLLVEYIADPEVKALILARDGKLVIRPDSGDPVEIICGESIPFTKELNTENVTNLANGKAGHKYFHKDGKYYQITNFGNLIDAQWKEIQPTPSSKGVIEILWDIFGGTINSQGYKVLDTHIGCIYGDSITPERQVQIYSRLANKGFAATNIVLGVGSYTYQYNTRDTFGFAAKGAWFEAKGVAYNIYKDPATDDGTKKSLKGLQAVFNVQGNPGEYHVVSECTPEQEEQGILQVIYHDGVIHNTISLTEVRERLLNEKF